MKDKIVLITLATEGIGLAVAMAFARLGATVVIHGQSNQKTQSVAADIVRESGNSKVDMIVGDLFLTAQVQAMAESLKKRYKTLDVLVNNSGGVACKEEQLTAEKIEKKFALNVLAPFLLTNLLLDQILKSIDGRIINITSHSQMPNTLPDFDNIQLGHHCDPLKEYGSEKMFLIWNSRHLAMRLRSSEIGNVSVNTVYPGAIWATFELNSDLRFIVRLISCLLRPFYKTAQQAAETIVYLATAIEITGVSGQYFVGGKQAKISSKIYTDESAEQAWGYCQRLVDTQSTPF